MMEQQPFTLDRFPPRARKTLIYLPRASLRNKQNDNLWVQNPRCATFLVLPGTDKVSIMPMMSTTPIDVADTAAAGTAGMVHQYAHSEVMGMDTLQQRTRWWLEDVVISLRRQRCLFHFCFIYH